MRPDDSQPPSDHGTEQKHRLQALSYLANKQQQTQDVATYTATPRRAVALSMPDMRPKRARWQLIVVGIVLLGILASIILHFVQSGQPQSTVRTYPAIVPASTRLDCPHDVAWSPDGSRIAVLGYVGDCPNLQGPTGGSSDPHISGLVNIYAVPSGRLLAQLHPDPAIVKVVTVPPAVVAFVQQSAGNQVVNYFDINYTHLLWSKDGTHLALTFDGYVPTGTPSSRPDQPAVWPGNVVDGVLLVAADGSSPRVLSHPIDIRVPSYSEWDLATGSLQPVPSTLMGSSALNTLPPALRYQWGAAGALIPQSPLDADSIPAVPPLAPIGNPDGGAEFSIWQPGIVSDTIPSTGHQASLSGALNYSTDIAAWSPDGRYIIERLDVAGPLVSSQTSVPNQSVLAGYGWEDAPRLPMRDLGLQQAAKLAATSSLSSPFLYSAEPVGPNGATSTGATSRSGLLVAWRPDGRFVAVETASQNDAVAVYDCMTGRQIASFKPAPQQSVPNPSHEEGEVNLLRWSPDGSSLALFDTTLGTLTIWNAHALPK